MFTVFAEKVKSIERLYLEGWSDFMVVYRWLSQLQCKSQCKFSR